VNRILPPPWDFLGATWRLAPSHQLIGALDPPAVTSVSAPNTRSLIFVHGGVDPGVRPVLAVLGQVSSGRAGGKRGLGSGRFLAGFRPAASSGSETRAKSRLKSLAVLRLLRRSHQSPCSGWMCDGSYCTSAVAPQVPRGGIWPFGDLTIDAHQLALVLVPCQAVEPTLANLRPPEHGSMARTGAPGALRDRRVVGFGSETVDSGS
jgi:hypothetical protein